jgi:uncharacterized membrane protein YhaH (DUF805 family)
MTSLVERYLSFRGRLARLPFFIRGLYLGIAAAVVFAASLPLFSNGARVWWWAGLIVAMVALALLGVGSVSLIVRRLHDVGLAGYHAIWVGAAEAGWLALSYAPPAVLLLGLSLAAIGLWLAFWPGNAGDNRFGVSPA